MAFGKRKQADNPPPPKEMDWDNAKPQNAGSAFMREAEKFAKSDIERTQLQSKVFLGVAGAACVAVVCMAVALAGLTPLKTVEPFVVRVDNNTGVTDVVATRKNATVENKEVMDKYWLATYVRNRETYDWQTIQTTYDTTMLLSSEDEQARFAAIYSSPASPDKVLENNYRISVKIRNIAFVGDTAQVRFSKTKAPTVPQNNGDRETNNYIATIAFSYENQPTREEDFLVNPLGFQVTSYRADPELLP